MIYAYGITLDGKYHVKNNIPNQDAFKIVKCNKNTVIAAVADGLGSAEHSDIASKLAVEKSVAHCEKNIPHTKSKDELLPIIKESFLLAQNAIEDEAKTKEHDITKYDTTLTLVIFCEDTLFFGHSGDSGIVALTTEGLYKKVTEQQRDESSCVFPLFFKDKWIFEEYKDKVSSVFLATDGILETLFPIYIRNEKLNIHITLAQYFMDNRKLEIEKNGEEVVAKEIESFLDQIPEEQVNDDKTIVVLINTEVETKQQPDDYYKEPNWDELRRKFDEAYKMAAYPHLYANKKAKDGPEETVSEVSDDGMTKTKKNCNSN